MKKYLSLICLVVLSTMLVSNVLATEVPQQWTINVATTGGGTASQTGLQTVPANQSLTITAYPDTGYVLESWNLDGTTYSASPTITVPPQSSGTSHTLQVFFTESTQSPNEIPDSEYTMTFELELFAPAKVTVTYLWTMNFSVTNVRTVGNSLWTETGSPVGIEFNAKEIDTYEFDVDLSYSSPQEQVIQVGYWNGEGALPPSAQSLVVTGKTILIHFKLSLSKEPKVPTAEEVAEATTALLHQDLVYYFDQITLLARDFEGNITTQWVLFIFALIAALVALIIGLLQIRRTR